MEKELFLHDSYLKSCRSTIAEIMENKVILDQTIFYPSGGGQPSDTGIIRQGSHLFHVVKVKREHGRIVHYLHDATHLKPGSVEAELDWDRRYTFMRYHTLLHVIAGHLYNTFGALAASNEIYEDRARIDFKFEENVPEAYFSHFENEIRQIIEEDHPVTTRTLPREEIAKIPGSIKTIVNLLPASIQQVRLVAIQGIDEQACGGTHVRSTREIGAFSIVNVKNKGNNIKRVEVVVKT
ncbi:alanyl-tRNA editing protein [Brevibacillus sp. SYP-B805]|uniref:alanyl-tRNA editing protein n=1 Tax=Brevibacillus sp. SYP-B805 TaxID=1578199 RepID=UPI0013ED71DE|nr:alanyl-tRNA editing protein [Brevibacillus sp. SYP-B805]NGQ93584.1 alanyl-tRNA editing protein [Brevibacillus sp. SYP-B805]